MKVLIIAQHTKVMLNYRGKLLAEFVKAGHQVTLCGPENHPDLLDRLSTMGILFVQIPLGRTGMNPIKDLNTLQFLTRTVSKVKPDVVFSTAIKPVIYGSLAARMAGVSKVYSLITGLGYAFMTTSFKGQLLNKLTCWLCRLSLSNNDSVFFQNPDDLALFKGLNLIREDQGIVVNGSGVDLEHFTPTLIVENEPVFLLIARLIKDKGIIEYVEAARILKRRHPKVIFRLVGGLDSNPSALSKSQVEEWHQEGVIDYCGETNDVRPLISASSVYVLPTYREGTPLSVLEAMAMGRPIITTDTPGCRETVVEGKNGFLVPVKDEVALAEAMEHFIINPDLIKSMGQWSRKIAVEKYDVNKVNAKIMKVMGLLEE